MATPPGLAGSTEHAVRATDTTAHLEKTETPMLIEQDWKPGVWIDGQPSDSSSTTTEAIAAFAHDVHSDILAARDAGRIPAHVETTISASTITPLWNDDTPIMLLLHIRFTGLADPIHAHARNNVIAETLASLDRRGTEHLTPDQCEQYAGALFFVDDDDRPHINRTHTLRR